MRVLQIMATGAQSGGARHLFLLCRELQKLGHTIHAAVGTDGPLGEQLREIGVSVRNLDIMEKRLAVAGPIQVGRAIRDAMPDLVHLHGTRGAFFGALAKIGAGLRPKFVYTIHGLSYRKERGGRRLAFTTAELLACRSAARVISVSKSDMMDVVRRRLVQTAQVCHIPNAIDLDAFRSLPDRGAIRQELGLPSEAFVVGTVARLVPGKGVADLLQAACHCPGLTLAVVGDGPERPALERQARRAGVSAHFLGERDDTPRVLAAMDLFVLPSYWEGEPVALLEAMAAGVPSVATKTVGAEDLLCNSGTGVLVPIGQPEALAAVLRDLAIAPTERLEHMSALGRQWVADRTPERMARQVAAVYGELGRRVRWSG